MRSDAGRSWIRLLHLDVHPSLVPSSAMTLRKLALGLCVAERFMQNTFGPRRARLNHLVTWWPPVTPLTMHRLQLLLLSLVGSPFCSLVRGTFPLSFGG